ncbi:MAG: DUF1592 domain-containing protein [Pirellulaceae bacterium]
MRDKRLQNLYCLSRAALPALITVWVALALAFCSRASAVDTGIQSFVAAYCLDCHGGSEPSGSVSLAKLNWDDLGSSSGMLERAVRQLNSRQMPPLDAERPGDADYQIAVAELTRRLDQYAIDHPNPGRVDTLRRLSRTEYGNAIRDLLAVEIDAEDLLPADESSHGFDNVTVGELSPMLLNRYVSAAQKISRLAIGGEFKSPLGQTFRIKPDVTQEEHVAGLPLGTRGGMAWDFTFPRDGEYEIVVRLARDRNEEVEGLRGKHEMIFLVDRQEQRSFAIQPPKDQDHSQVDQHLRHRFRTTAGTHALGVTFLKKSASLVETMRQPYDAHFNMHRHPRLSPAVFQISITGPYGESAAGSSPSRDLIFARIPKSLADEDAVARASLERLTQRAYRHPPTAKELGSALDFYHQARQSGQTFEAGMQSALNSILVSPSFLFRVERDPADRASGEVYRITDLELASRLSFFLWSSIPDDELLQCAMDGKLHEPDVLRAQTRRMLADPRSQSLVDNFAAQWLYLRNLDSITPDMRLFPDFDDNLRQSLRRETELLFESVLRQDRSALDLLSSKTTFLNERLAKHYGIPHIYGDHFRVVDVSDSEQRGGLLRHGSILTVTSYATRTSPVIRGHWILKNLVGCPPPPPPDNVPALEDNTVSADLPVRQRLAAHRANPACASCHDVMDPVGFALENYDAIGRWRTQEAGQPVESLGGLPDGSEFRGVSGLEAALLARPHLFVGTLTEKLLTFGLGRGMESYDAPAVRQIIREAESHDYRFSALVEAIVSSQPFQFRKAE